jgi:hypothetical protein
MTETVYYPTIARAEQAIIDAGFKRDPQRALWVHPGTGKTAKVMRDASGKFYVNWS